MEVNNEDIIIVGGGICGLAAALALHRMGIRSLVLESSESLRAAGIAFTTWTNAWRVLDALGIGESLRKQHEQLSGITTISTITGKQTSFVSFTQKGKYGDHEVRCVKRKVLLEALAKELPSDTIRFSSKVVSIEDSGFYKLVHLSDGSVFKTKVVIGCDGVGSVVAKSLGFKKPTLLGRSAIRGFAYYPQGHGIEIKFHLLIGNGIRCGLQPTDEYTVTWFLSWSPSTQEQKMLKEADQQKMKQFVLSKLGKVSDKIRAAVEDTPIEDISTTPLGYRPPWQILFGNISKDNMCVAGDSFHLMSPDLGQGACIALESGVILAKCLGDAFLELSSSQREGPFDDDPIAYEKITTALYDYASKRRWRAIDLISTGYMVGIMQECKWFGMNFLRDNVLSGFLAGFFITKADLDPKQFELDRLSHGQTVE